ncbi:MAG: DUF1772 domain-containing protein [Neomegalonema sp.]|nr:DUF1772 domain-containing protein [Neomegalonema sp.]
MTRPIHSALVLLSLLLSGAIFGFFYAWVCSTMWGLDQIDPRAAIEAMQGMNASVRNFVFAPAFFGTPIILIATGLLSWRQGAHTSARLFIAAGLLYFFGAQLLTMTQNVPMNEALARITIPTDRAEAAAIWQAYSQEWQLWNITRTIVSGIVLLLSGLAIWRLPRPA